MEKQLNRFCRMLRRTVRRYLDDKKHRKEFEKWYLDKYGKPYEWKKEHNGISNDANKEREE